MNRIDRLFGVLLLLQRKNRVRAEDIAERYGITVRTVYRDIAALHELGVPIISMPGEGYALMEGFYLPPLVFTPDEAASLFLGGRLLAHQADGHLPDTTETALEKIANTLPRRTQNHVNQLSKMIHFYLPAKRFNLDDQRLLQLQRAIVDHRVVHIAYHSLKDDSTTQRDIEPLQLTYSNLTWYVTAYCQLREGIREFRLDRIESMQKTLKTFSPRTVEHLPQDTLVVKIRMKPEQARWVYERQHYGFIGEDQSDDSVVMTYHIHQFSEIKAWILAWGASVQILSPEQFVDEIREEVKTLLELLT